MLAEGLDSDHAILGIRGPILSRGERLGFEYRKQVDHVVAR